MHAERRPCRSLPPPELQALVAKPGNGKPLNGKAPPVNGRPTMIKRPRVDVSTPPRAATSSAAAEPPEATPAQKEPISGTAMIVWLFIGAAAGILGTVVIWSLLR